MSPTTGAAAVVVLLLVSPVAAQPPPRVEGTPALAPVSPLPPTRPRAVAAMTLESPAFADGGLIPDAHAQRGHDVSPPLAWRGVPEGTVSLALVVRDLDSVPPGGGDDLLQWLVWNIAGAATGLPAGVPEGNAPEPPRDPGAPGRPASDRPRQISATGPNYRGPNGPAGGPEHHVVFELYALDVWIDVAAVGQSPAATRAAVIAAMAGHVRGKGVLTGRYRRPAP